MNHIKLFENYKGGIEQYIEDNNIQCNGKYPKFLYHATDKELDDFFLDNDIDWEDVDGNGAWDFVMPSGYIFLTDDIREAVVYGRHIIPFELTSDDIYTHKTYNDQPSIDFDDDYNYSREIWDEFEDSMADTLEMKGHHKSTFVSRISVLNPRIDIAKKYYNK